jgi:hypothetical protein
MRNIVQQLDSKNWRALDYFRMVENKSRQQARGEIIPRNITVKF